MNEEVSSSMTCKDLLCIYIQYITRDTWVEMEQPGLKTQSIVSPCLEARDWCDAG